MNTADMQQQSFWKRSHHLDRMTLRELVVAYFQYPAIIAYLGLAALSAAVWVYRPAPLVPTLASVAIAILLYPLAWYTLHRWVLHSNWMFKLPLMAATWKRIHYDHHQDPNHLEVLFGALHTTLPTIAIATAPIGYAIGGIGGAAIALSAGLVTTCIYEFCHCIQHLSYKPKNKTLAAMKARHMAHHFHDEKGNYGITNFFWDRLFGTFYERHERKEKSPTVFNLGYTDEVAKRYPWVKDLSGGVVATGHPRQRDRD
ncbi:sterol desaturase family protein [Rhizorhapis suberifaciens]|uniref:Sterol desaturase/sphingolipid hydroxylase (Fatty acid hydroxylase superfamily) n=1 Tax=Rhizorhapis suberifaciens TaxID=13656 RepID=A0A840HR37_9SPHN|nr:sterol desaturase/sphingolipid hydroxylase (fatty acid hydroxylase superfamily) [Rhizorhapis suberifaciens]